MININYKKYIGYFLAGVVGVLFIIGLRGASAANPTVPPPTGDAIPTFSGLTVQNGAKIQGALEVADISASGNIDMSGDLQVSKTVEAGGELRAKAGITNPAETKYGSVAVGLPVEITDIQGLKMTKGPLNIKYDELNSSGTPQSAMIINGLVSIKGGLLTNRCDGSANMDDPTKPSYCMTIGYGDGTPGELAVLWPFTTDVDFRKNIKNTKGDVTVNDSLKVTGDINAASMQVSGKAAFLGDTEIKNAYITGSLQNSAATGDYIKVDDALDVRQGIFNNDGTSLVKLGSGTKSMNLQVTGKIKASGGIGTYSGSSATASIAAGKTGIAATYCPSTADLLLGCYFSANSKDTEVYALDKTISSGKKGCYTNFINSVASSNVTVSAICFNPTN